LYDRTDERIDSNGFLVSLQTLACTVLVVPGAMLSDRAGLASRWPFTAFAFCGYAAFPLALVLAPSTKWLVAVFAIRGLTEVGDTVRKALIVDFAEGRNRGRVIGAYFSVMGAILFPAAFIGGWLWEWLPIAPFVAGGAVSSFGVVWFLLLGPKRVIIGRIRSEQ